MVVRREEVEAEAIRDGRPGRRAGALVSGPPCVVAPFLVEGRTTGFSWEGC